MRTVAKIIIVLGVLLGAVAAWWANVESHASQTAAIMIQTRKIHENPPVTAADRALVREWLAKVDELTRRGLIMKEHYVSPWPGIGAGVGLVLFGILLLAIRRPERHKPTPLEDRDRDTWRPIYQR